MEPKYGPLIKRISADQAKASVKKLKKESRWASPEEEARDFKANWTSARASTEWILKHILRDLVIRHRGQEPVTGYLRHGLKWGLRNFEGCRKSNPDPLDSPSWIVDLEDLSGDDLEEVLAIPSEGKLDSVDRQKLRIELEKFAETLEPVGKAVLDNMLDSSEEQLSEKALAVKLGMPERTLRYHKARLKRDLRKVLVEYND